MELFLNEERRTLLGTQLVHLKMPEFMIPIFTDYPNDIEILDAHLAANIHTCLKFSRHFAALPDDADSEEATALVSCVLCDLCILQIYGDEIKERKLDGEKDFPNYFNALCKSIEEVQKTMVEVLSSGKKGAQVDFNISDMVQQLGLRRITPSSTVH